MQDQTPGLTTEDDLDVKHAHELLFGACVGKRLNRFLAVQGELIRIARARAKGEPLGPQLDREACYQMMYEWGDAMHEMAELLQEVAADYGDVMPPPEE